MTSKEHELWIECKQGNEEARKELIESNLSLVEFARRLINWDGSRQQEEDIESEGRIALILAVERFDPAKRIEFITFAVPTIRGQMLRWIRDTTTRRVRNPPSFVSLDKKVRGIRDGIGEGFSALSDLIPSDEVGPEESAIRNIEIEEAYKRLAALVSKIREPHRKPIWLMFAEGKSQLEAGRESGYSQMHISRILSRFERAYHIRPVNKLGHALGKKT